MFCPTTLFDYKNAIGKVSNDYFLIIRHGIFSQPRAVLFKDYWWQTISNITGVTHMYSDDCKLQMVFREGYFEFLPLTTNGYKRFYPVNKPLTFGGM